jgi:hypothetical protein
MTLQVTQKAVGEEGNAPNTSRWRPVGAAIESLNLFAGGLGKPDEGIENKELLMRFSF